MPEVLIVLDWQGLVPPHNKHLIFKEPLPCDEHKEPSMICTHLSIIWALSLLPATLFILIHVVRCAHVTVRLHKEIITLSVSIVHSTKHIITKHLREEKRKKV